MLSLDCYRWMLQMKWFYTRVRIIYYKKYSLLYNDGGKEEIQT